MAKVLDFKAVWCGPCRTYGPIFEKVSKNPEFKDITFESIDVDENEDMSAKYSIRNIPTTVLVNDSDIEVGRRLGYMTEEDLVDFIKEVLCES